MRIRWLKTALQNLDDEIRYIERDDPISARLVAERIFASIDQLADQPGLGRPGRVPGTRELVVIRTRYLIPYRVKSDAIEILRVFHSSRRLPTKW